MRASLACSLSLLFGLVAAAPTCAQTIYVVDANGGADFTRITDAVNAAVDGDTIVVRPATYTEGWTTGKAVQILGDSGAIIRRDPAASTPGVVVSGVAVDRRLTLRGFRFEPGLDDSLVVSGCGGGVHVEALSFPGPLVPGTGVVRVVGCAQVSLTGVTVESFVPIVCETSTVSIVDCMFMATSFSTGEPALTLAACDVSLVGCHLLGGAGDVAGAPGIAMSGGRLTLAGRSCVIRAGGGRGPVPGIDAPAGEIAIDPAVIVVGATGGPPISGGATVLMRRVPSIVARHSAPRVARVELHAPRGSGFCLFGGVSRPVTETAFGALWFDTRQHVLLACGVLDASEAFVRQFPIDSLPPGLPLALQSISVRGATLELSEPAVIVVD